MRIDLQLKEYFSKIFNPLWNKILFPSICFKPFHETDMGHPRVNDTILFFPKKYFNYLTLFLIGHNLWEDFILNTDLTYEDLDTMLDTYHDSDSQKDWNPIYRIVNRPETSIYSIKDTFDKYSYYPSSMKTKLK